MIDQNKTIGEVFDVIDLPDETIIYIRIDKVFKVDYGQKVEIAVIPDPDGLK